LGNFPVTTPTTARHAWGQVKLLGLDIDGVLTDGGVVWDSSGGVSRRFDIKDGLGLVRFQQAGGIVVVISSSSSQVGIDRLVALGISEIFTGVENKTETLTEVMLRLNIDREQAAFMGDDLPDLGCFDLVRLALAPQDAVAEVRHRADYVTAAPGGRGAVREVCDAIWEQNSR
jgi:3-deoxy-D-manno-octulosonate 8-phosphate phosphatase (KDO 8-P phosphatase)